MKTEETILVAAAELLERVGTEGLTTRAVCTAANITAPTLYHHFGDKDGLLNALVSRGISDFMKGKRLNRDTDDPLADLKRGWDRWIEFALKRPILFRLMLDRANREPELAREAYLIMRSKLERMHAKGMLAPGIELDAAARAVQAASNGVLSLLAQGATKKDIEATGLLLFAAVMMRLTTMQP